MEPVTTAIATIVSHLAKDGLKKAFDTTIGELTKDSVTWFKSIFWKEGKPKEILQQLEEKPDSPARQKAVRAAILIELEEKPEAKEWLMEIYKMLLSDKKQNASAISNSENFVSGTVSTQGGDFIQNDLREINNGNIQIYGNTAHRDIEININRIQEEDDAD